MDAKKQKSQSYSPQDSGSLTIYDAPNVCREMMAKCQSLAARVEPEIAEEITAIGNDAKRMLDAIVASVDQILAMEA